MSIYGLAPRSTGESRVQGRTDLPLRDETIPQLLAAALGDHGAREALVFPEHGLRLTYAEFAAAVDRLATGLLSLGISRGDRVGIWAPNRPEWVLTQFATARIGAILVNVNPAYRVGELEYALRHVGVRCLILADSFKSSNYVNMIQHVAPELAFCAPGALMAPNLPDLRIVVRMGASRSTAGILNFADLADTPADTDRLDAITRTLRADDAINIQFTSGTTGLPKGAALSHRNIAGGYYRTGDSVEFEEDGSISFIGRADDVITSSGYRIGPFDVESALLEHPAVREAAVVGVPDPERTEIVKAFVVLAQGHAGTPELAKELRLHVRGRLSAHSYPRRIDFVADLPKTPSGKIQRFLLRKAEVERQQQDQGRGEG